ncbi:MAG TPA: hypothetical protein VHN14_30360, partial [Kofleriaceae bacterium]|nr:hypothetical protein [Kofleriaceae bacterium]
PLVVTPIDEPADAGLPMAFDIAVGVRRSDTALAGALDRALIARRAEIDHILAAWGVPRLVPPSPGSRRTPGFGERAW